MGLPPERITLTVDVEDVPLSLDAAIPSGLIVSELVSNALKHAFGPTGPGAIHVALREDPPGVCVLTVRDDGIGLSETIDLTSATSLGLQLVTALAGQLDGVVSVRRDGGTEFTIRFPGQPAPDQGTPIESVSSRGGPGPRAPSGA